MGWEQAGAVWSAHAWDWAMYAEPFTSNSYDLVLQRTGVGPNIRLLDVACGAGLAIQRASAMGATCTGVDASETSLEIAGERTPSAELILSGIDVLPFENDRFDVVTSFNGLQFGGDAAVAEAARVLRPGGVLAMMFWESPGDLANFFAATAALSPPPSPGMPGPFRLSEPGVAQGLLERAGLQVFDRVVAECVGLSRNADDVYQGWSAAAPAQAAIAHSGEDAWRSAFVPAIERLTDQASGRVRLTAPFTHLFARKP